MIFRKKEKKVIITKSQTEKAKKNNQDANIKKFKEKYFDYYDDIKDYTKGKEDW